jgi:hypothetical protein
LAIRAFIVANDRLGLIPSVSLIHDLIDCINMLTGVDLPLPLVFLLHLFLGSYVLGCGFALLSRNTAGFGNFRDYFRSHDLDGVMLLVCPIPGQGFFGLRLGFGLIPGAGLLFVHGITAGTASGSMQARPIPSN